VTATETALGRAERIAALVLAAVGREYPNHLMLLATSDADLRPPRELTPAFFGSFDWHSAVHGHWCLVRLARCFPDAPFAAPARTALAASLNADKLAAEHAFVSRPERAGFERPYGLAWLLQLGAELREWDDPAAREWRVALAALERLAMERLAVWLPRLRWPIRGGEHAQTAFALGLALDWARVAGEGEFERLIARRALELYGHDRDAPIAYEPGGHDFLSPALGEADLMRRVLGTFDFVDWLSGFLPHPERPRFALWLTPVASTDRADGKLAHLDGLNLSRAWMLEGIAAALPEEAPLRETLGLAAATHRAAGLAALDGDDYAGTHWLGSFAAYLLTGRGLGRAGV
jgi:hypothetical protein